MEKKSKKSDDNDNDGILFLYFKNKEHEQDHIFYYDDDDLESLIYLHFPDIDNHTDCDIPSKRVIKENKKQNHHQFDNNRFDVIFLNEKNEDQDLFHDQGCLDICALYNDIHRLIKNISYQDKREKEH